ncbi:MAG: histidine phosphatase family protein [Gemmatimonadetes bacterium]|nr:histidine phosphatase family protein [Gemmatimonadota bacterium]
MARHLLLAALIGALVGAGPAPQGSADDRYVVLVRHAEKADGDDPDLTAAGRARAEALAHALSAWDVEAVFVSQFLRTRATAVPLARRFDLEAEIVDARDVSGLVERIRSGSARVTVVVGHSNTVPALARGFGASEAAEIPEHQYDDLLIVRLGANDEAHLLHMKYGAPTP